MVMAKKTLKKKKASKVQAKKGIGQIADPVIDSARDIWRAGLGAFAMAQQEGGKVVGQGTAMFDKLVAEGQKLEAEGRKVVDKGTSTVTKKVTGTRDEIEGKLEAARKQAEDRWDKLENVFEERVARVMAGLGVPSGDDLKKLASQVESLSKQVSELARQPAIAKTPAKKPAGKSVAAKKPAAKKAAPKKAVPKKAAPKKASTKKTAAKKVAPKKARVSVYHLLPKDDKWVVRREGEDKDIAVMGTKRATLDAARKTAQSNEPSRLVVHRADGTIQDSFNYGEDD
jgi:poly(hydroxyalkanoate) granule-associated protein